MSYCRWSSNDWDCDLYCYEHVGGFFAIHVASNRVVGEVPKVPWIMDTPNDVWLAAHRAQMAFLETAERKTIGLPHDGQTFEEPDLESFRACIVNLRAMGYHCPDGVLDSIDEEIKLRDEEIANVKADAKQPSLLNNPE